MKIIMASSRVLALELPHEARNHNHPGSYCPCSRRLESVSFHQSCEPESTCEQVASQANLPALRWLNNSGAV